MYDNDPDLIDRGCHPKRTYLSKSEAKKIAQRMSLKEGVPLHLYTCDTCGYFHVGHLDSVRERVLR